MSYMDIAEGYRRGELHTVSTLRSPLYLVKILGPVNRKAFDLLEVLGVHIVTSRSTFALGCFAF